MVVRRKTRPVHVGNVTIGGAAPISIQSMTNCPIEDVTGTLEQVEKLKQAGADIVRLALRNSDGVPALKKIVSASPLPVAADIHFDYRLALAAIEAGVHKIRINPGNIGGPERLRDVVTAARDSNVAMRVGVNAGSLDKKRYPHPTAENMVASALESIALLEEQDFHDIIVSLKSSDVALTIAANRLFATRHDYPLHLGLTEAGYGMSCVVSSAVAIGTLLMEGIGDTIRVSMTGDPVEEIPVARRILEAAGARKAAVRIVSCPTCGRTDPELDLLALARKVEDSLTERFGKELAASGKSVTVAVMGCEVNGPGEAAEADVGVAGGRGGKLMLFSRGEKIRRLDLKDAVDAILAEVERLLS